MRGGPIGALKDILGVLTFRVTLDDLRNLTPWHLCLGLVFTWIVGMGRWWDDPNAIVLQRFGVGSVVYVFVLSLMLWFDAKLLCREEGFTYGVVLTYVTMTSPPAILYTIPVELWNDGSGTAIWNSTFLGVVATWRVAMLVRFYRLFGLTRLETLAATGAPLSALVLALGCSGTATAVASSMGGYRDEGARVAAELASMAMIVGFVGCVVLGPVYLVIVVRRRRERNECSWPD